MQGINIVLLHHHTPVLAVLQALIFKKQRYPNYVTLMDLGSGGRSHDRFDSVYVELVAKSIIDDVLTFQPGCPLKTKFILRSYVDSGHLEFNHLVFIDSTLVFSDPKEFLNVTSEIENGFLIGNFNEYGIDFLGAQVNTLVSHGEFVVFQEKIRRQVGLVSMTSYESAISVIESYKLQDELKKHGFEIPSKENWRT